jgi:hypothetical protein
MFIDSFFKKKYGGRFLRCMKIDAQKTRAKNTLSQKKG